VIRSPPVTAGDMRAQVPRRVSTLRDHMDRAGLAAVLCAEPGNLTYLAGFRALLYSRPILLVVRPDTTDVVVPRLEELHARRAAAAEQLHVYDEHPRGEGAASHLACLESILSSVPPGAVIGIEAGACPAALAQHLRDAGHPVADVDPALARMRMIKDAAELALIERAARMAERGVLASLAAARAGTTELEVDAAGTAAVMSAATGSGPEVTLDLLTMTPSGRARSVLPHALSSSRRMRPGDTLIHTRQVGLDGYRAELERTAFIGAPDPEMRRVFEVVRTAQEAAIDRVRAGVRCSDVDRAAREVIDGAGLGAHAIHRTGHGIGLSAHEPPYLRYDNHDPLAAGMVITIEPGVYVPGLGGCRHSDTLRVGVDGPEPLTSHPRDLASLTLGESSRRLV
jgi:Xaa-Pro dipeptidase